MSRDSHLSSYLNDHLAGSSAGLELLEHVADAYPNTDAGRLARVLHREVSEDRAALQGLMERLGVSESLVRQGSGWVAEKLVRLKLRADDPGRGPFHLLESLEALSLGIEGKRLLWVSLEATAGAVPADGADLVRLERRAADQRERVEIQHRAAAQAAFGRDH